MGPFHHSSHKTAGLPKGGGGGALSHAYNNITHTQLPTTGV